RDWRLSNDRLALMLASFFPSLAIYDKIKKTRRSSQMITQKKIQQAFTIFVILVFLFNLYELITARLPRGEMAVVILECLAGIALIYLPQLIRKFLKVQLPVTIIYFYWFFLGLSVFLGTCLHLIRFIPGWDK